MAGEGARAVHLDLPLTRADVEAVATPLLQKTLACIDAALRDAGVRPGDLDRVLLVGGASKMPIVRSLVAAHLGRPAQTDLDADRAVALGASLLAGRTMGADIAEVLVDITPHTLVAGVVGPSLDPDDLDAMPVIERGAVVPIEQSRTVVTMLDDQKLAAVPIAQGEEPGMDDNTYLGEVRILMGHPEGILADNRDTVMGNPDLRSAVAQSSAPLRIQAPPVRAPQEAS